MFFIMTRNTAIISDGTVENQELPVTKIKVIGVGGAGGNMVNSMTGIKDAELVAVNTDKAVLRSNLAPHKIQIGQSGLGAGGFPAAAEAAARESMAALEDAPADSNLVFITAGMGGGTGTGAAPVIAEIAKRDPKRLVIGVVTRPFAIEGERKAMLAQQGIEAMRRYVDCLIIIPNDRILNVDRMDRIADDAFAMVNDVLRTTVRGISDMISTHGKINIDFNDLFNIMRNAGDAMVGVGKAAGDDKYSKATAMAMNSRMLENGVLHGAREILISFSASRKTLSIESILNTVKKIRAIAHEDANVKFGYSYDEKAGDELMVVLIATRTQTAVPQCVTAGDEAESRGREFTWGNIKFSKRPRRTEKNL